MKKKTSLLFIAILIISSAVAILPVKAQAKTLVVPDHYPSINSAVGNATDGDTILLRSGTYQQPPLITNKSISLIGEGSQSTIVNFITPSHVTIVSEWEQYISFDPAIQIFADNVKISSLTINSTGGLVSITGNNTQVTGNFIITSLGLSGSNLDFSENTLSPQPAFFPQFQFSNSHSLDGNYCKISDNNILAPLWVGGQNNIFSYNNVQGDLRITASYSFIYNNNLSSYPSGIFSVTGSDNIVCKNSIDHFGFGLTVGGSNNTILLNNVTHCGMGVSPRAGNFFYANYIANSAWGVDTGDTVINPNGNASVFYHNNIVNNIYGQVNTLLKPNGVDYFDNGAEGNYWSDYHGTDANGDGIGDSAYIIGSNRTDRYPLMAPFNLSNVPELTPSWALPPALKILSPQTPSSHSNANVSLDFVVNKEVSWMGYSLDGKNNVTVAGNFSLSGLNAGMHNVTVYANDSFGNVGASETINFSVTLTKEPFPTTLVVVSVVSVIVIAAGLTIYFKKRNTKKAELEKS